MDSQTTPLPSFIEALDRLERDVPDALAGPVLDVASGRGRHALVLARRGIDTWALDNHEEAIDDLRAIAVDEQLPLYSEVRDLETEPPPSLGRDRYSLIIVVSYLHRPLTRRLVTALKPGGVLFYDTFTVDQPLFGKPTNPRFLLEHGELEKMFGALDVLWSREGIVSGHAARATLVAQRPAEGLWTLPHDGEGITVS